MSVVNNILVDPVNVEEVYNYMGVVPVGPHDIGTVCTCSAVTPESIIKPIKGNTAFYDCKEELPAGAWDNPNTSGWEVVRNGNVGGGNYACFNMRVCPILATDYKRLTDFNGYKKGAVGPGLAVDVSNISGYGQGSAFMGSGDTSLSIPIKVTFPEIRPGAVPVAPFNPSTGHTVQLVRYKGNDRVVVWEPPRDPELPTMPLIHTAAQWKEQYGGKTKTITVTETSDLPVQGSSKDYTFYLEINGCHQRNGKVTTVTARAWRQFQRFDGSGRPIEGLYDYISPTKTENYGEIFFSSCNRLRGRNTGNAWDSGLYLRIKGLFCAGNPPKVEIYAAGKLIATCNNTTNVVYSNGAKQGYANPYLSSYSYQLGTSMQTVQALDVEIRCDSIAWDAAIELRSVSRFGGVD